MSVTQLDPELRQAVIDAARDRKDRIRCQRCERTVYKGGFEIDHVRREIDTGPAARTDPGNLQVLCKPCHKRKTALEAAADAKRNQPPRNWRVILTSGSLAIVAGGLAASSLSQETGGTVPWTGAEWIKGSIAVGVFALCTFLVQNAFTHRAPPEVIPVPVVENAAPVLDVARIAGAFREAAGNKGDVRVTGTVDRFTIAYPGTGFADHEGDKKFDLVQKIAAKIGDRWEPTWDTHADQVTLSRRPALPRLIHHPGLEPGRAWNILPVAEGVSFDLLATPHILIAGETGGGKTAMMRAMICAGIDSARRGEVRLILIDPKRIEMMGFEGWPGVQRIVREPEDLWEVSLMIKREVEHRYRALVEKKIPLNIHPRWLCVWDEFAEYAEQMNGLFLSGEKDADDEPYKRTGEKIPAPIRAFGSTLALARKCGIHNIVSTQSPNAPIFGNSGVRQNMPGRASVGSIDGIRASMLYGDSSVGRDIPSAYKGRATVQIGDNKPVEIQTFWVPDPADADPNYSNTADDWKTLARLGMPKELVPAG